MSWLKIIKRIIAISVMAVMLFTSVFADDTAEQLEKTLKLSADTSDTFRTIGLEMYGVGGEWGMSAGSRLLIDFPYPKVNQKLVDELKAEGLSFGFYRQAGASSVMYRWKDNIGSVLDRNLPTGSAAMYSIGISAFGIAEQIKIAQAFEGEDAMIDYTINTFEETPQDIADLAEYLYGDGVINYNGGENWAKKRIAAGIPNPVNVYAWELGNEYDATNVGHMFINSDIYVAKCKEYIAAIRSVKPDAKIAFTYPMLSAPVEARESYWVYNGLLELLPLIDYVVIHGYVRMDTGYVKDKEMLVAAEELDRLSGGRVKIINTEYNAQGTLSEKEGSSATAWGYGAPMYFAGARTMGDVICRYIKNEALLSANYYAAVDGTEYSCCYLDNDNKYKPNVTGYVLAMFQKYGMGDAVKCDLEGFELQKKSECSGAIIKDKDGYINVILVNNTDNTDINIDFDFDKDYVLCEEHKISAEQPYSMNYIGTKEVSVETNKIESDEVIDGYKLDKLSIVALKLEEADK